MNRGWVVYHETLNDAEVVVDDLGEGSQAVGCAWSVAVETRQREHVTHTNRPQLLTSDVHRHSVYFKRWSWVWHSCFFLLAGHWNSLQMFTSVLARFEKHFTGSRTSRWRHHGSTNTRHNLKGRYHQPHLRVNFLKLTWRPSWSCRISRGWRPWRTWERRRWGQRSPPS